ncbi:factor XIIa inhibitor-like [Anomaloglossus baeobatrachus]|uniref:factor XIIa inhibitor-like n=1 Tax=Anomaloglossus baeobatrachus TaxID=238106 RepID=UPI003F4FE3A1
MQILIHVVFLFATAMCKNNGSVSEVTSEEIIAALEPNSEQKDLNQETSTDIHNVTNPQKSINSKNEVPIGLKDPSTEKVEESAGSSSAHSPVKDTEEKVKKILEADDEEQNGVPPEKENVNQCEPKSNQTKDEEDMEIPLPTVESTTAAVESTCSALWPECTNLQNSTEEVSRQLRRFTLEVYRKLSQRDEMSNIVISPFSIALGLSQLLLGSSGETRKLMLEVLYGDMENPQCVHHAIKDLTNLKSFISANEIFFNKDFSLKEEFRSQSEKYYGSQGIKLKNDKMKDLNRINNWVSTVTDKRIPDLFKELPDFELMLISVIYYQGQWLYQFDPKLTKKENFKTISSGSVKVPTMNNPKYPLQSLRDAHLQAQVARLPLSSNYSLIIFLPLSQGKEGLKNVERELTEEILNLLITQLIEKAPRATTIAIPQLKLDSEFQLTETLSLLGLSDIFEYPEFCALSDESDLVISDVRHRAVLEIKESGVKAAAATSITVARTMPVFLAQKPFLYVLVNEENKIPIIIGRVTDPSK